MKLSFRNRIAFHYMIATAIILAMVFTVVYLIVTNSVYTNLDTVLAFEADKHSKEIKVVGDSIHFISMEEWEEREHKEIQVNPIFIQIMGIQGNVMDKSPNLKADFLPFMEEKYGGHFDVTLDGRPIRQAQIPIKQDGKIVGYILAAISSESAQTVILRLRDVLLLSFLFVLMGLYFISRFLAGRSIIPIRNMTFTINRITKNNLTERVHLPANKDELYDLASGFNELLLRIENAIKRERQFTSDASHELRTPLATLRGTLEVLIRKPREQDEYKEKISFTLKEIDRMTSTLEQLLLLARFDSNSFEKNSTTISLPTLIDEILTRQRSIISEKKLTVELDIAAAADALVPMFYTNLILDNIINNAIKYSRPASTLAISIRSEASKIMCTVKDQGIGIKKEDLKNIFENFFRSDSLNHKTISGNGLGLSIAKKSADAIGATISVTSELNEGTTFTVVFSH